MNNGPKPGWKLAPRFLAGCLALLVAACAVTNADAQTTLRWKLKAGESFHVSITQETSSQVAFSGKQTTTKIDLGMDLAWKVVAADANEIHIQQSIQRVHVKLNSPKAGTIEYDSAAQAKPAGPVADVAAAIKPLLGAEVELTMNDRGEIQGTKPVGAAAEALFAEGAADQPGVFSKKAIQQLLRQPLALLPEKPVAKGAKWTTSTDITAAAGVFKQATTYTLADEIDRDGQKVAKIEVSAKLTPPPADPQAKGKLTLKTHQQSGTIFFATETGRLVEAETKQDLVTERPYRETTIVVTLHSQQQATVTPNKP